MNRRPTGVINQMKSPNSLEEPDGGELLGLWEDRCDDGDADSSVSGLSLRALSQARAQAFSHMIIFMPYYSGHI